MTMSPPNGKVALVTGGASGIGKETAIQFARHGAKVAILDIDQARLEAVHGEIKAITPDVIAILGDVRQKDNVDACVDKVVERFGCIDYLVNSAGILKDGLIARIAEADFDDVIATNLKGVFLCLQACARSWTAGPLAAIKAAKAEGKPAPSPQSFPDRRVVTIASMAAEGNIGQVAYSASKAGVLGLTKTAAKELIQYNIKTHAVMPTLIDTPIIGDLLVKDGGKWRQFYESRIPLGIGQPKYVADVILFLCSDAAGFMNGTIVPVNGGKLGDL